jgi:hypothetical protein
MPLMNEQVNPSGQVSIEIYSPDGKLKDKVNIPNLVVQTGRNYIASRMNDTAQTTVMSHMGVGSGSTAATLGDTVLGTELIRVALDSDNTVDNVITYIASYAPGVGTGPITEAGIFNDAAANTGDLLCRTTFLVVNKAVDDSMVITWTITIS